MLLIATPFILLQNYLVEAISVFSGSTFEVAGLEIPIVPVAAMIFAFMVAMLLRRYITRIWIAAGVVAVLMIALSQQIADYYFGHNFYDLQQNWHYIAYGLLAFMMYRDLAPRGIPAARIMLVTYISALLFSTFDEIFQMYMSSRVFDLSDTAKDLWGTLSGIVVLYLVTSTGSDLQAQWKRIRHRKLRRYLAHPPSLLVLMVIFALLLLGFGSLLSDSPYALLVVVFSVSSFVVVFLLIHVSQLSWVRNGLVAIVALALIAQSASYIIYRSDGIVHNQYGLTVYEGIPIIFFDVMIFPDGSFRLVDKKHHFNLRDQDFLNKQQVDIIVIGSGTYGKGGLGFPQKVPVQFVYNPYTKQGTQVIILNNAEACKLFNRLKAEHKNVLFILHNTC